MRGYGYGYGGYGMMGGNWFGTVLTIAIWAILIVGIVLLIVWATRMARHGTGHGGPHGTMMGGPRPPVDRVVPPHVNVVPPPGQHMPQPGQGIPPQPAHMQRPMPQQPMGQQPMGQQPMQQHMPQQPIGQAGGQPMGQPMRQPAGGEPMQAPAQRPQTHDEAVSIARRRLASGEISRAEYDEIMNGLRGWPNE